ncbi:MAG: ATP-binding protein [Candidatus Obscuribacterales bacterium]|nr:ATP-binding protein [Steroidobacteraceae bacterium]
MKRPVLANDLAKALKRSRVVALIGPRQCGKTTLLQSVVGKDSANYFDLEDPESLARLNEPMTALRDLRGVVAIDEVQRRPDLFPILRVLADRKPLPARFLLSGSAAPALLQQSSESLAGRLEIIEVGGFQLADVGGKNLDKHWQRGGLPLAYLARTSDDSFVWRRQFIRTFLQHDLPQLGIAVAPPAMSRFWAMLAHYHGNIWNAADPARSLGVGESTVRRYLDALSGVLMVRQLKPWHENLGKRQVKAPKVYVRDSGLLHALLGIRTARDLLTHPKAGAAWEGYAIEEILKAVQPDDAYYWATYQGAELDLLLFLKGRRVGIEIKRTDAPTMTPSMRSALQDLKLDKLIVAYPGTRTYPMGDRTSAMPLSRLLLEGGDALLNARL